MKIFIITSVVIILLLIIQQSFTYMSINKTESQKYRVIIKEGDFEIRFYPSATLATIKSNAKTYKELSNPGFRKLAGYIFGGNESNTSISMTSPVHMNIQDTGSSMSFVMPSAFTKESLPKPNDSSVIFQKTPDEYVAAIRFSGYTSDNDLKKYSDHLEKILKDKNITSYGPYRYLGYNPPFQVIGRRNEVIVSVIWKENSTK